MASTLTSSSTLAEVRASYIDNASYAEDASVTKAKAFITACRILLLLLPAEAQQSGRMRARLDENLKRISEEMENAQDYVTANDTTAAADAQIIHANFNDFRG